MIELEGLYFRQSPEEHDGIIINFILRKVAGSHSTRVPEVFAL